jgi:N-sulfoglucosamine sulfohydrolase
MANADRPNILILLPHDLGDFLGCYGHSTVRSPNIDQLAGKGVMFRKCFTTAPECTPSRSSLMTGLYTHQNGLMGLSNFGWSLKVPHLAERLKDTGYRTHQFGFQHETHQPVETLGYDHAHHDGGNEADKVCANLCSFIKSQEAQSDQPWFACAGFRHVHRAWPRATRYRPEDVGVPDWLPDVLEVRKDLARFYQDIEDLDTAVGTVFQSLEQTGVDKKTLVIFTTDHGAAFPGAKATFYDPGIHVPLILHWAGQSEGGMVHNMPISNMDVAPTLLELAGSPLPKGLSGRSFLPLLQGRGYTPRDEVCGALYYDVAYDPMHYVRTESHKYIRSFVTDEDEAAGADPETLTTFAAGRWVRVDDFDVLTSPSWQELAPDGGSPRPPTEELYDLRTDPRERINLARRPEAQSVLTDMRKRLQIMMLETDSPLIEGHVPPPDKQREAVHSHGPGTPLFWESVERRKGLQ